jgi:hypothetical protein
VSGTEHVAGVVVARPARGRPIYRWECTCGATGRVWEDDMWRVDSAGRYHEARMARQAEAAR